MAQRTRSEAPRGPFPRVRTFGTAAATGRQQFAWIWSRESVLRLVLSFVLASALWLYISNKQNPSIAQDYSNPLGVSLANLPDGMTVSNTNLGVVYVRFKRSDPNTPITQNSFHPFVDLLGLRPGTHTLKVQVPADPGIQVVQVRPASITVVLLRLMSRHVTVQPNVVGKPPAGYGYKLNIQPSTIAVSGPETLVPQVSRVVFDIDLSGQRASSGASYPVRPENSQGAVVVGRLTLSPPQVHVGVAIQPSASYSTLPVLAQITGVPKTGVGVVSLVSNPSAITLTGSPGQLSRSTTVRTAPVSVARRGSGTFTRRVPLVFPRGTSSHTRYVSVTVRLAPVESSTSVEIAVTPVGVSSGLRVSTISPARLFTTIVGPSNALHSAGGEVQATVNVTGFGIGTYTLTPVLTSSTGVHVETFYPRTVTVTLLPAGSG